MHGILIIFHQPRLKYLCLQLGLFRLFGYKFISQLHNTFINQNYHNVNQAKYSNYFDCSKFFILVVTAVKE